jgi:glucosamine--fructose-6-phosphate aminotransferase (isomerizing)
MCGIVGAVAERNVEAILITGLKSLEYRGYDSAGVAIFDVHQNIQRSRVEGKVDLLQAELKKAPLPGHTGIAHTRWATHGVPSEANAHPHTSANGEFAIVHNGIIENYLSLREELIKDGYVLSSETDSEMVVHLLAREYQKTPDFLKAVQATVTRLHGAFSLAILHQGEANRLIAVRQGSPLVIGLGIGENFIASDQLALLPVTRKFIYLEEGDMVDVYADHFDLYDKAGKPVSRKIQVSDVPQYALDRGQYSHFMLKEIFEQPVAVSAALEGRIMNGKIADEVFGPAAAAIFDQVKQVQIVACGTSFHAGLIARYWFESYARIPCNVEIASEIRYRAPVVQEGTLFVTISQSGETADTLSALRHAKESGYVASLAICNVAHSSAVRESDLVLLTRAGPEIGVASTKAFTTQLIALLLLMLALGRRQGMSDLPALLSQIQEAPRLIESVLALDNQIATMAEAFMHKEHALFLGRGIQYPVALEGALKLKEISYIHAEAYPAGELKHGPLALIDENMPVVALVPNDELIEKLKSNLEEVRTRGGKLFLFVDESVQLKEGSDLHIIRMPTMPAILAPLLYNIPLQLLAYHVAFLKGTDIDKPRNLAKSVTVE